MVKSNQVVTFKKIITNPFFQESISKISKLIRDNHDQEFRKDFFLIEKDQITLENFSP